MNQYIITEEELDNIADLLKRNSFYQSVIDEHLDSIYNCPYNPQAEQEKMLDDDAINILKRISDEEPECEMSLSKVVKFLWDDYCDSHGEPDIEIG